MSLYQHEPLHRSALKESPVEQFRLWFEDTQRTDLKLPMAMSVSTVGGQGRVSSRVVLLRGYGERGFVFFTNYQSRKAQDLDCHPFAALLFYWEVLGRQVRIEGRAERLSAEESDAYFASRPRGNQLSAYASYQSQVISSRDELVAEFEQLCEKFDQEDVSRPGHWGGYRVVPDLFEFWQDGEHRLHDRLRYTLLDHREWKIERLAP